MAIAYLGYKVDSDQVKKADTRLDKMSKSAGVADKKAAILKKGFVALGAAMAGAFAGGRIIQELSQFGSSMSQVAAITRATDAELKQLRATAKELGSTTEFSAAQAADGLKFLGMAGFTAAEGIEAIPAVLDLATASSMGLASAADIASNVLSGFGKESRDAGNVADVLAAASTRSNTTVTQLGQAMSTAAPVARSLGVSMEDTAAAIGVMSDAGIQGSRAGTGLRGTLAALSKVSTEAEEVLANYGLTAADVSIETHGLTGVMDTLSDAGLSTADAMTIFGREAASGALTMIEASDRVKGFGQELTQVDGAAKDMAATMRDNLGGDIKSLMSAVSGLVLALGDAGLTAILRGVVKIATGAVRAISGLIDATTKAKNATVDFLGALFNFNPTQQTANRIVREGTRDLNARIKSLGGIEQKMRDIKTLNEQSLRVEAARLKAQAEAIRQQEELNRKEALRASNISRFLGIADRLRADIADVENDIDRALAKGTEAGRIQASIMEDAAERMRGDLVNALRQVGQIRDKLLSTEYLTPEQQAQLESIDSRWREIKSVLDSVNDEVDNTNGVARTLSTTIRGITFSAVQSGAERLADRLSLSVTQARLLKGLLPNEGDPEGLSFGLGDSGIGGTVYGGGLGFGNDPGRKSIPGQDIERGLTGAANAAKKLKTEIDRLEWQADPIRKYNDQLDKLNELKEQGLSSAAYSEELSRMNAELADSIPMVNDVASAFGDFIANGFKDFKSFAKSILSTFKRMLSDMIAMAVRNKIMFSLGFGGGGGGATSALAGGSGGGGGLLSSVLGGGGSGGGGGGMLGGIGAIAGAFGGGFGNAAGALFGSGGGIGTMFSSIGAQVGTAAATGTATSIAAAAGAVALPLAAVAVAISLFVPKIKELDRGIRVTADGLETSIEQFRKIEKSRLFGLIKSRSTNFKEASDAVADPILNALGEMQGSAMEAARVFGFGAGIFEDFSASFKVSLKGLSEEEKLQKVNEELAKMGDEFASIVPNFENMNDLINAANQAIAGTAALGGTRFESQLLAAARRRGEITTTRGGPGFAEGQSLIRLQQLTDLEGKVEENTRQNNRLTQKMVDIFEQWEEVGIPRGPVVS